VDGFWNKFSGVELLWTKDRAIKFWTPRPGKGTPGDDWTSALLVVTSSSGVCVCDSSAFSWLVYGALKACNNDNYYKRRLADAPQSSPRTPEKQSFCFNACPSPCSAGMRSPSSPQWTPNEKPLQPLFNTLLSFHARGFVLWAIIIRNSAIAD